MSFDRAVEFYDKTRALPAEMMEQVTSLLAAELRSPALEIGVGTGRMAMPVAEAGVDLVGIDISAAMLERLRVNAGGSLPFPVAVADATSLPFDDDSLASAMAVHVLHLIADWRAVVSELVRVIAPGGVILVNLGGWSDEWEEIEQFFIEHSGAKDARPGARDPLDVDEAMAAAGARYRPLPKIKTTRSVEIADLLDRMEQGQYSFTWTVDEATRVESARRTREWARERLGSLDRPLDAEWAVEFRAYDVG